MVQIGRIRELELQYRSIGGARCLRAAPSGRVIRRGGVENILIKLHIFSTIIPAALSHAIRVQRAMTTDARADPRGERVSK